MIPSVIGSNRIRAARRIIWTPQADARLARMRNEGASIRALAAAFGLSRSTVAERAGRIGLALPDKAASQPQQTDTESAPDPARDPLPAGHPISWGLITNGTSLEGTPYATPSSCRLRRRVDLRVPLQTPGGAE